MKKEWVIAGVLGLVAFLWFNPQLLHINLKPSPATPSPTPNPDGKQVGVVQARRLEILDANGKVAIVFDTTNTGSPIAIVNDDGRAITIDLVKIARYAK
jgi:hypothetical protein